MILHKYLMAVSIALPSIFNPAIAQVNKHGIKVEICSFDYDDDNFCTEKMLKNYAKVIKTRKPNFNNDKIIYIFESSSIEGGYRVVEIHPKTKLVLPLWQTFMRATDSHGNLKAINSKGDNIEFEFNKNSDKFCFKGNIEAYRDSYSYDDGPFCYRFDPKFNSLIKEY